MGAAHVWDQTDWAKHFCALKLKKREFKEFTGSTDSSWVIKWEEDTINDVDDWDDKNGDHADGCLSAGISASR